MRSVAVNVRIVAVDVRWVVVDMLLIYNQSCDNVTLTTRGADEAPRPFGAVRMYKGKETDPFYKSRPWRAARAMRLEMDNYKCVDCMDLFLHHGGSKPRDATIVHHVIPRDQRPDLELDIDNLRSLCDACHNKRHPEKGLTGEIRSSGRSGIRIIKI